MHIDQKLRSKSRAYDRMHRAEAFLAKRLVISQNESRGMKAFGRRVAELREEKRLSVYDVTGEDMPIKSRQHWQLIEAGQKNINLTTIFRIAKSLDVRPEVLFAGVV